MAVQIACSHLAKPIDGIVRIGFVENSTLASNGDNGFSFDSATLEGGQETVCGGLIRASVCRLAHACREPNNFQGIAHAIEKWCCSIDCIRKANSRRKYPRAEESCLLVGNRPAKSVGGRFIPLQGLKCQRKCNQLGLLRGGGGTHPAARVAHRLLTKRETRSIPFSIWSAEQA